MYKASSASPQPSEVNSNPFMLPALALNLWWPILPGERLDFVHRRLLKDVRLARQLAASKSPAEVWGLYADFLQHGAQDYWNEYAAMTRLTSKIVSVGVDAAQGRAHTSGAASSLQQAA